jgi:uncharacterized membrane protein
MIGDHRSIDEQRQAGANGFAIPPAIKPAELVAGRLASVDVLRGLIMVLMVLDHSRDFIHDVRINPTDPATTTVPLFLTRWVTHFCAPLFVFLAGASAYLALRLGKLRGPAALARFLAARGIFLIVLELTLIRLLWQFNWDFHFMMLVVIWVFGLSFLVLSGLVACRVPSRWIGLLGAAIVLGHNLLDLVPRGNPASPGNFVAGSWLITLLLRPGPLAIAPGVTWFVAYPLLPWFGIMALGYAFGEVLVQERRSRLRITAGLGLVLVLAFFAIRASGLYGDPSPWTVQDTPIKTALSFFNCQKYPPSLLYVLMTLGPGLLMLAGLDAAEGGIARSPWWSRPAWFLDTLGRVPLFFYVLQWPLIHLLTIAVNVAVGNSIPWFDWSFAYPPGYGFSLGVVYAVWAVAVAILFWPCRWFAELRRRRRDLRWLSYL